MKQGVNILVVDDEPMVRHAMKLLLQRCGHKVEEAVDGEVALARLTQGVFDVVITDFSMPGMQGDQLVARIRKQWPDQPIIMVTAFVEEYKVFGEPSGRVDALLLKPFLLQELQDAIERVLALKHSYETGVVPPEVEPLPPQNFTQPSKS